MEEVDVPPFFICPISMEIMKDPVTVSTGITYDRNSIEKWLFSSNKNTCPVTNQVLSNSDDLTPNHTVRRLIQAWCTLNTSKGVERFPTPKPPVTKPQISKLLKDATSSPSLQMKCLRKLRAIASESDANKRCMESAGAVEFLVSIIVSSNDTNNVSLPLPLDDGSSVYDYGLDQFNRGSDEALCLLHNLKISETGLKNLVSSSKNTQILESLIKVMQSGNYESRAYAILLLKSMFEVAGPMQLMTLKPEFFVELVQILQDQISHQASKATLQLLTHLCPWGRNKVKAVEAGAVSVLIDLLLDSREKRPSEMMLMVLDQLCGCAEGRSDLLKHGAGLAVVSKRILRVSHAASERAVRILSSVSKFSATPGVLQEMLQLGVVAKLCLVLQVDCGNKTREKAKEILKLHARVWKDSLCVPNNLLASYP